jgi:glyoxylase I family protein
MTITHFLHATLLVEDIARSEAFYEGLLGLVPLERNLSFEGRWYQVGSVQLHLIAATQVVDDLVVPDKWGRNRHLAFAIADLKPVEQRLASADYAYQRSSSGRPAVFIQDPDGNLIELLHSPESEESPQ